MNIEEEVDLRAYIGILLKFRFWILGLTIAAAVVGAIVAVWFPATYQATVVAFVSDPQSTAVSLAEGVDAKNAGPAYAAYSALALNDEIISSLIETFDAELALQEDSIPALRKKLSVTINEQESTIELTAQHADRELTPRIANTWAALFLEDANHLYARDVSFLEAQLAKASAALYAAEQALSDFQASNEALILNSQLTGEQLSLEAYWNASRALWLTIQDARSLQEQLRADHATSDASYATQMASLLLQVNALNSSDQGPAVQIQMLDQTGPFDGQTVDASLAFLESMIQALESKRAVLEQQATSLEPGILRLQKEIEDLQTTQERMAMDKQLAQEAFASVSRKLTEARMLADSASDHVRLVSSADGTELSGPGRPMIVAVAGLVGLGGSILGVILLEYWRQSKPESQMERQK